MSGEKMKILRIVLICFVSAVLLGSGGFMTYLGVCKNTENDYNPNETVRFIAHRGLSDVYYQNTAESFEGAARETFFWGIETDVWVTKDGKFVCCHDEKPFADKTVSVKSLTEAEATTKPLDPDKKGNATAVGDKYCPTFETYLDICKNGGKAAVIELKDESMTAAQVAELMQKANEKLDGDKIVYISFYKSLLDYVEKTDKKAVTQLLFGGGKSQVSILCRAAVGKNVSVDYSSMTKSVVKTAHRNGAQAAAWTVNSPSDAQKLIDMGVDFITTNLVLFK